MSKSFYKRLQALLLRRWSLIHVHETAIYRSEYPNPRSRNGGKNFWILSTACEQASDDTFPVSYLTKIEFYHTPEHLLNLKTSVLILQKTRVFYNLCTEENFIRTALFVFQWGFRRLIDLMFRVGSEEIEVRFVVSTTGKVSVRWYRLGNPVFIGSPSSRMIWRCKVNIYT